MDEASGDQDHLRRRVRVSAGGDTSSGGPAMLCSLKVHYCNGLPRVLTLNCYADELNLDSPFMSLVGRKHDVRSARSFLSRCVHTCLNLLSGMSLLLLTCSISVPCHTAPHTSHLTLACHTHTQTHIPQHSLAARHNTPVPHRPSPPQPSRSCSAVERAIRKEILCQLRVPFPAY